MESRPTFCLFCDDVREEAGGKISLMGIYGEEMIIAAPFPCQVPKFCINIHMISPVEDPPQSLNISVTYPPGTTIFQSGVSEGLPQEVAVPGATKRNFLARVVITPMIFSEPGDLEVFVETEREIARAGRLKIRAADPA